MTLTEYQKEFILKFFKNERFARWRNIAESLIEKGTVLTTCNHTDIWWGGIGNFIKSKESSEGVGLWLYEFDLSDFLSSAFLKEYQELLKKELKEDYLEAKKGYKEIKKLNNDFSKHTI